MLKKLILLSLFLLSTHVFSTNLKQELNYRNNLLIKHYHANIGMLVAKSQTNKILYQKNSQQYFMPASLQKLFTASAATLFLKPSFTFKTQLLIDGKIQNHIINGNLYLKFSGDPSLSLENIFSMLQNLTSRDITEIKGRVYLDETAFDHSSYPDGTSVDDLSYAYASPVKAMNINENQFNLFIKPTDTSAPKLTTKFDVSTFTFHNQLVQINANKKNCSVEVHSTTQNNYTLTGCINRKKGQQVRAIAIRNVDLFATNEISRWFKNQHITYKGPILFTTCPQSATVLATHRSKPLAYIIRIMLKQSDNLISNTLLKTLCHQYYHKPGTWKGGLKAMFAILAPILPIKFKHSSITDGAGLSHYNLLTPRQILAMLNSIMKNPTLKKTIFPALPIAGRDGTLQNRMKILGKRRRISAKTGTMKGVSNIAGFAKTRHHGNLIFVIMDDDFINKVKPIRRWQNKLLTNLALYY